jgi:hypothetical protein
VIGDQCGADTLNLVGADRLANAASANRHAAFNPPLGESLSKRDHEVWIIVIRILSKCAEVYYLIPGFAEMRQQLLL